MAFASIIEISKIAKQNKIFLFLVFWGFFALPMLYFWKLCFPRVVSDNEQSFVHRFPCDRKNYSILH